MADAEGARNARAPAATARAAGEGPAPGQGSAVPRQDGESSVPRGGCSGVRGWSYRRVPLRPRGSRAGDSRSWAGRGLQSMTATAQRRPITSHPGFAPVIALWFAALLGLTVAVLPGGVLERVATALGLGAMVPLTPGGRVMASALAAALGAPVGFVLARIFVRRAAADPRPIYAEADHHIDEAIREGPVRRPLRVREELADGFGDESRVAYSAHAEPVQDGPEAAVEAVLGRHAMAATAQSEEGFMILTPQPVHPPLPAPDLEALLDQFDSAFASFRAGEGARGGSVPSQSADPVQAFVARQTGVPASSPGPAAGSSPLGGLVPDHQAELRAALDKLARSQRGE